MRDNIVKRTERGWAGHFICADSCRFRRNTLLELDDLKIVVSIVGAMISSDEVRKIKGIKFQEPEEIGYKRHYETMAFAAKLDGAYLDADVQHQLHSDADWSLLALKQNSAFIDNLANEMHENFVNSVIEQMKNGTVIFHE